MITAAQATFRDQLLLHLTNPNLDILLLLAGLLLLYTEFNLPGTIFPGAAGILCVLLAVSGLSQLPLRPYALGLLACSFALYLLELKRQSRGTFSLAATIALIFGLIRLVAGVHPTTVIAGGLAFGAITFCLATIAFRARHNKRLSGAETMHGLVAQARSPLQPGVPGQVVLRGQLWSAFLAPDSPPASVEQQTVVVAVEGHSLIVRTLPPKV